MRVLRYLLAAVLILLLTAVFYVAVVLGTPQETAAQEQALPAASASFSVSAPQSVDFPAQVLVLADGSGWSFTGGSCYDQSFENGVARIAMLQWRNDAGETLTCATVYPARAVTLLRDDAFALASGTPVTVAGVAMIRLTDGSRVRLQASGSEAAWVLTLPAMEEQTLSTLLQSVMLISPAESSRGNSHKVHFSLL